jgi:hypothetical protein
LALLLVGEEMSPECPQQRGTLTSGKGRRILHHAGNL